MSRSDLLVVAGEASGDMHAARMLSALTRREPGLRSFGMGGAELAAAGLERVADSSEISVVGLAEVFSVLERAREIFDTLLAEVERRRPAVAVLVDFPEFNLRLARELKWRGIRVVYYVSPQIWAWRRARVRTVAQCVDRMLVLFPFEAEFYRAHGVPVVHVGHPLVDEVPALPQAWDERPVFGEPHRIALLPGSRRGEVDSVLPRLLGAARLLGARIPARFRLIQAPSVSDDQIARHLEDAGFEVELVRTERFRAIADSHLAVCASGTATLEVGLLGTPLVVVYRLSPWTYTLGRLLVRVPSVSLVNLVLRRPAVPELIQNDASPERIAVEVEAILATPERVRAMRADLADLRAALGEPGASERAADEVERVLAAERAA